MIINFNFLGTRKTPSKSMKPLQLLVIPLHQTSVAPYPRPLTLQEGRVENVGNPLCLLKQWFRYLFFLSFSLKFALVFFFRDRQFLRLFWGFVQNCSITNYKWKPYCLLNFKQFQCIEKYYILIHCQTLKSCSNPN